MSAATYGTEEVNATIVSRGTSLQRPFQIFIISGDFLLILLSYLAAGILYRKFMGSPADQEVGAGLIVGLAFVTIAFFQGVYEGHRLLNGIWQARKVIFAWMLALTILAAIIFNILSFHIFMAPAGLPLAVFVAVLWVVAFMGVRQAFSGLFQSRFEPRG